jgi:hypothetical protein
VWFHITTVVDSTGAYNYLNGELYTSTSWDYATLGYPVTIDQLNLGGYVGTFSGYDDVRVYAKAVDADTARALYRYGDSARGDVWTASSGTLTTTDPNLKMHYDFEDPFMNDAGVKMYLPFDTDLNDHSRGGFGGSAYRSGTNLETLVDTDEWMVGGGSMRQQRDNFERVFDAATIADLSTFQNSYLYEIYVQQCNVTGEPSFDFSYYTDYRVLDLRCGNYQSGDNPSLWLQIQLPGTFPVDWTGNIYAGGWSSSPDTNGVNTDGTVKNGIELWSSPAGQNTWTLSDVKLSGTGLTGTRQFTYIFTVGTYYKNSFFAGKLLIKSCCGF